MRLRDAATVVRACREGLGGAEAWAMTSHPGAPLLWMHTAFDSTVCWRVRQEAEHAFAVDALWVAAIPNERLANRLRTRVFAEAREAAWLWTDHDYAAWAAAESDDAETPPAPFAWSGEACVGGPAEGDGGLPVGLCERAEGITWRILAASPWRAFVRAQWEVPMYGEMATQMARSVRLRQRLTEARRRELEDDLLWVHQPNDTQFYGNQACPLCEADGRCLRCLFCFRRFASPAFYFHAPSITLSGPREWEDDLWTLMDLRILP